MFELPQLPQPLLPLVVLVPLVVLPSPVLVLESQLVDVDEPVFVEGVDEVVEVDVVSEYELDEVGAVVVVAVEVEVVSEYELEEVGAVVTDGVSLVVVDVLVPDAVSEVEVELLDVAVEVESLVVPVEAELVVVEVEVEVPEPESAAQLMYTCHWDECSASQ